MLRNLKISSGQTVSAAGDQVDQTTCQSAFADGFHGEPAANMMASSDHTKDDCMLTSRENMESTTYLLTEWALEACGIFKADSVFLIKMGACAVVEDIAFQFERELGHAPKSVAYAFVDVRKQTLVI